MKKNEIIKKLTEAPVLLIVVLLAAISLTLNYLLEALGRHSPGGAFLFMLQHPVLFLYNTLIILFTLSVCLLFKRRLTVLMLLITAWIALGITNFIVLAFRASPLSAIDFVIVKSAFSMFSVYLTFIHIIFIIILAILFLTGIVLLYIKCPKCRVSYRKSVSCIAVIGITVWISSMLASNTSALAYESSELAYAYESYGFAYCFTQSLLSQGVDKPENYSRESLGELRESLRNTAETTTGIKPNIIYIQLESFFDVNYIERLKYSDDPTPVFNSLKREGVSGFLQMANVGGGTANSEFEILTGMNLDHFGFGEYPYISVLKSKACESIAANLKKLGYSSHALHNHTAVFYDRNIAYANLGFDTFTPVEMMTNVKHNPLGWECDAVLTQEILSALDSTEGVDFVFGVTVQGHGKYPSDFIDADEFEKSGYAVEENTGNGLIEVYGTYDSQELAQYTYYVNQLRETDNFISELISALTERGEPCVVVFYGDHMPALALSGNDLANGDIYQTEYAIWTNTDMFGDEPNSLDRDFEAYMLSAYVQQICGYGEGEITLLHQLELKNGAVYSDELRMLEYAQLYDEYEIEYESSALTFGTQPITITGWQMSGNSLYITGSGFNEYSVVKLNNFKRHTIYIDENTLIVDNVFFFDDIPEVVQLADDGTELYSTNLK